MRTPVLVDGRNVLDMRTVIEKGFEFRSIGKRGVQRI